METQTKKLLAYLKRHGSITPMQALTELGIMRLGARVYDLRAAGHSIDRELIEVPSRTAYHVRVARYSISA